MAGISPLISQRYFAAATEAPTSNASNKAASSTDIASKDEFLKLLVAQLQNQDPLNPMQGDAFVAQLATFSSLEQLVSINENIQKLVDTVQPTPDNGATQG
jgi:flagellar basal-body rod modification protein FlgD